MAAVEGDRFAFEVEWLDHNVGTKRKYQLMYYTANGTIEMVRPHVPLQDGPRGRVRTGRGGAYSARALTPLRARGPARPGGVGDGGSTISKIGGPS